MWGLGGELGWSVLESHRGQLACQMAGRTGGVFKGSDPQLRVTMNPQRRLAPYTHAHLVAQAGGLSGELVAVAQGLAGGARHQAAQAQARVEVVLQACTQEHVGGGEWADEWGAAGPETEVHCLIGARSANPLKRPRMSAAGGEVVGAQAHCRTHRG